MRRTAPCCNARGRARDDLPPDREPGQQKTDDVCERNLIEHVDEPEADVARVLNVDKNPPYPAAVRALRAEGTLPRRVRLRQCKYFNNIVEQNHRAVKKRVQLAKG